MMLKYFKNPKVKSASVEQIFKQNVCLFVFFFQDYLSFASFLQSTGNPIIFIFITF